jgi:hypothetical protein
MTTTTFTTPTGAGTGSDAPLHVRAHVGRTGALAGVAASVATFAVAAIAHAGDVSLKVSGSAIPVIGFAEVTFVAAMIGTVIAVVLSRRARRPRTTFVTTTVALTLLSFVPDAFANAHTATKLTLVLTHLVAAAIVIPALASRLGND